MVNRSDYHGVSDKDSWRTPEKLIEEFREALGKIHTDPATDCETKIGSCFNYTKEVDGLLQPWYGNILCNPPFTQKSDWLRKAVKEVKRGNAKTIVFLTPDGTGAKGWWHKYIAEHSTIICFTKGRVNYVDPETDEVINGVGYNTAISIFGEVTLELLSKLQELGHVVTTVENGKVAYDSATSW